MAKCSVCGKFMFRRQHDGLCGACRTALEAEKARRALEEELHRREKHDEEKRREAEARRRGVMASQVYVAAKYDIRNGKYTEAIRKLNDLHEDYPECISEEEIRLQIRIAGEMQRKELEEMSAGRSSAAASFLAQPLSQPAALGRLA